MTIKLTKPLIFIDIETTGLNIGNDRIVEVSLLKLNIDNSTETKTLRVNPEMEIPDRISKIHGIYANDIKNSPTFKQIAPDLIRFIDNSDFAGFNSNKFDVPMLIEEFLRCEIEFEINDRKLIDVQNIFHFMEPRNLSAAYKFYCNKTIQNAHSAEADVTATFEVFKAQLIYYKGISIEDKNGNLFEPVVNDVEKLTEINIKTKNADLAGRIAFDEKGNEIFTFGKHKDKTVVDVFTKEPAYYNWIMNGDFPRYTKKVITKIRLKMK